jgi:starch phosphorylase
MQPTHILTVLPSIPPALARLRELAFNLRWSWDNNTIDLFRRLERDLWETTGHNPVAMLGALPQSILDAAAADESFLAHLDHVYEQFRDYMDRQNHVEVEGGLPDGFCVAYFSAEYGLTECLRIYSGGLGMLAGDILKSSSDLGLPLVGVGILYQEGYARQYLNPDGWQQEVYEENDFYTLPIQLERGADGSPLRVQVPLADRKVATQVWRVQVGRTPLFLLDTNLPENSAADRAISARLYTADPRTRLQQQALLGIGGMRTLDALNIRPTVCHMNEGDSALLVLERIRKLMLESGVSFEVAREAVFASTVFTTHTCVSAAINEYPPALVEEVLSGWYKEMGLTTEQFLGLGRYEASDSQALFCPFLLALRLSAYRNGVSRLHSEVSRRLWQRLWPTLPSEDVPIVAITNGVHLRSWTSHDMAELFDRYVGPRWVEDAPDPSLWHGVQRIPGEELWRTHERRRERLVAFARHRLRAQMQSRGVTAAEAALADEVLDPRALTIGFARRFATYKRGALLFRDPERLAAILGDRERPVQVILAGKSHPDDGDGKQLIREVVQHARSEKFRRRVVFLEDYDMIVARYLVQGVDVWLNTPRRPLEASGTSGMKASANGALNLSVLDGWWDEAYRPELGWAIGRRQEYDDLTLQDELESSILYDALEQDIVPLFYDRGPDGLPRRWIARMKDAMEAICPAFNTTRVLRDYLERLYVPAGRGWESLTEDGLEAAAALGAWKAKMRQHWPEVRVESQQVIGEPEVLSAKPVQVELSLSLAALSPDDVQVALLVGRLDAAGELAEREVVAVEYCQDLGRGKHRYKGLIPPRDSGRYGFSARILPRHPYLADPYDLGLVSWA